MYLFSHSLIFPPAPPAAVILINGRWLQSQSISHLNWSADALHFQYDLTHPIHLPLGVQTLTHARAQFVLEDWWAGNQ